MIIRVDVKDGEFWKIIRFAEEKNLKIWQNESGLRMFRVYSVEGEWTGNYRSYLFDDEPPELEDNEEDWPLEKL